MSVGKRIAVEILAVVMAFTTAMPSAAQTHSPISDPTKATFDVQLPADAKLEIAGHVMPSSGALRRFQVPVPAGETELTYPLKAAYKGKSVSRELTIKAGRLTTIDLRVELDDTPVAPGTFSLLALAPVVVVPGEATELVIRIKRDRNRDPVVINFKNLPAGIVAENTVIPPDKESVTVSLHSAPAVKWTAGNAQVEAEAGDRKRTQPLLLSVNQVVRALHIGLPDRVYLLAGGQTEAKATVRRTHVEGEIQLSFHDLPPGVQIKPVIVSEGQNEVQFTVETLRSAKTGPMSVRVSARHPLASSQATLALLIGEPRPEVARTPSQVQQTPKVQIPQIPVAATNTAKDEAQFPGHVLVKIGKAQLVQVPVDRQGYQGPLTLKIVGLPEFISAQETNLPAGRESARMLLAVDDTATPATGQVRLVAIGNNNFKSEMLLTVRVGK